MTAIKAGHPDPRRPTQNLFGPTNHAPEVNFSSLLSCSQSRTRTQNPISGSAGKRDLNKQAHTAGGRD